MAAPAEDQETCEKGEVEDLEVEKTILSLCDDDQRLRQMLHAHELSIRHPESGESISFRADLPSDFSYILSKLSKYKKN